MCETSGSSDPTDLALFGEEEDDESVRLKEYFGWWEPGHNENEYGNFPTDLGEKCVQHRTGKCAGVKEDPGGRETCVSSTAEQDACLLEDDSVQSMYSCPSPTDGGGDDLENLEALGAHVCDNFDAVATTVQHLRTAFRQNVRIEPPEKVPVNSESITSVGVERKFAVRNVTELIVDDRGRETRLNGVDGSVRGQQEGSRDC